ncbi:MAG: ATP-dependent zinc metalloprotease FtsH [Actinomycetota bacterium]
MPDDNQKKGRFPGFDLGGGDGENGPRRRTPLIVVVGGGLLAIFLLFSMMQVTQGAKMPYSEFLDRVDQGQVTEVTIADTTVQGTYQQDGQDLPFRSDLPPNLDSSSLTELLTEQGVEFTGAQPNAIVSLVLSFLPLILVFGILYYFMFRRMGGGAGGGLPLGGRSKVKVVDRKEMKTTFGDVAGLDEAVDELHEIVDFLMNPKKYQRLGGRIPKGVLLLGPPGCGKTLLARAVAGEANVPFFFMSGSEFVEMFVGLGAARVRELFQQAKEKAPALVFLDEIDTIGKGRAGAMGSSFGGHDEREQTLNQLLVEMDGFDASKGVIIMAATNRPDVLDPALVRPGRFDRQVVVDRPDLRGRERILQVHARGVAIDPSVDLKVLATRTAGFTGADLANVVNEAALLAARREKNSVPMVELEEAIDRVVAGLERKSRVMSDKEREIVAKHEMGHALVALSVENADPVHRVSIIPRGAAALGMTMQRPLEDRYLMTEPELRDRLAILLGGRTAEEICFGEISTGAQNDLEKATEIARAMVVEYGMSPKVGPLSFGTDGFRSPEGRALFPGQGKEMSEATAEVVDQEVARLVNDAHERARSALLQRRDLMERLSELLMVNEVIEGRELVEYVQGVRPVPTREEAIAAIKDNGKPPLAPDLAPATDVPRPPAPPLPAKRKLQN